MSPRSVAPEQNQDLAELEKQHGAKLNIFRVMAHKPEILRGFAGLQRAIMGPGSIDERLKQILYIAVSYVNECEYCLSHHIPAGEKAGLSKDDIRALQTEQDQDFSIEDRTAIRYARELTRDCDVDDDVRQEFYKVFTQEQAIEITSVIALANYTNRFNNGLAIKPE